MQTHIWWIRRDLRLNANSVLQSALEGADCLLPVFILDPAIWDSSGERRKAFLVEGLRRLDDDLQAHGSRLILLSGRPGTVFQALTTILGPLEVFAETDFNPYAQQRDAAVAEVVSLHSVGTATVRPPQQVLKADGAPYTVFTPFSKAWLALPLKPVVNRPLGQLPACPSLPGLSIPILAPAPLFPAGEAEAARRAENFKGAALADYALNRDRLDLPGTSQLSPYLKFGMLSPHQLAGDVAALMRRAPDLPAAEGARKFLSELIWRDFYHFIGFHFPRVLHSAFNLSLRKIAWRTSEQDLSAWQNGQTGVPIVDACMRQLATTGWMHNRGRMICASFLVKDLLINWQIGESWFMQQLIDADLAVNNGNWQWVAGVGTDAAPYFRIFNPLLQSQKFDPHGVFIRTWLPELNMIPNAYIHAPWTMPTDVQSRCCCRLGKEYPYPIVEHASVKERVLAAYQAAKIAAGAENDNLRQF